MVQSDTSLMGIRLIFTWLPALFAIIAGLAFIYYPLRDAHLLQIEEELVNRRLGSNELSPALSSS